MNISKQEIDRLAIESYERLTNRSKDSNTCLFYRIGFEAGFRKAQELERFSVQMSKTPVEVNIDVSRENRNDDVVRKCRDLMKQQTKEEE